MVRSEFLSIDEIIFDTMNDFPIFHKLVVCKLTVNNVIDAKFLIAPRITRLIFQGNNIETIDLESYPKLNDVTIVSCPELISVTNCHQLKHLDWLELKNCPKIDIENISSNNCKYLQISNCNLGTVPFRNFPNIEMLHAINCNLTSIQGIEYNQELFDVSIYNNDIRDLSPLIRLPRLRRLDIDNNLIDEQNPRTRRFIMNLVRNTDRSVYEDHQNVHNPDVQRSVNKSIDNILQDPVVKYDPETIINSSLPQKSKEMLIEYCSDETIHSISLLKYSELFAYVWARIIKHEAKDELLNVLVEQLQESDCMCFTGRFNRLLITLMGFYDDININISNSSRISAIIINTKKSIVPYNSRDHIYMAVRLLHEAGYTDDEIKPWIDAIEDLTL